MNGLPSHQDVLHLTQSLLAVTQSLQTAAKVPENPLQCMNRRVFSLVWLPTCQIVPALTENYPQALSTCGQRQRCVLKQVCGDESPLSVPKCGDKNPLLRKGALQCKTVCCWHCKLRVWQHQQFLLPLLHGLHAQNHQDIPDVSLARCVPRSASCA